jgi:hypothetical protein
MKRVKRPYHNVYVARRLRMSAFWELWTLAWLLMSASDPNRTLEVAHPECRMARKVYLLALGSHRLRGLMITCWGRSVSPV